MGRQFGCQTGIELAFDGWAVAAQVSQGDPPSHGRSTISTYRDFDKFKKMDAKRITPGWTELAEKTGLDPLGMQNASTVLYQSLLPGISNVTLRVRYYGLYPWLVDQYARLVGNPDPVVWRQHIRRAEAVYALVAQRAASILNLKES